jgi:hypothetical protein
MANIGDVTADLDRPIRTISTVHLILRRPPDHIDTWWVPIVRCSVCSIGKVLTGGDAPGRRHAEFPRTGNGRRRSAQERLSARKRSVDVWETMLQRWRPAGGWCRRVAEEGIKIEDWGWVGQLASLFFNGAPTGSGLGGWLHYFRFQE